MKHSVNGINWIDVKIGDAFIIGGKTYVVTLEGPIELAIQTTTSVTTVIVNPIEEQDDKFLEELKTI